MAIDLNDPFIQNLIAIFQNDFSPPDIKFQGRQFFRPVMEIEHVGTTDGFDVFGACLRLTVGPADSNSEGLVIHGQETLGNLIRVFNQPEVLPDYTHNTLVVSYDGRMGIMTPLGDEVDGRLELDQHDDTPVLVIKAFSGTVMDLQQMFNDAGTKVTWIDHDGSFRTDKDAFFSENIQVGSQTADIPTFSGSAIGLTNLSSSVFTGTATNGIAIVATDSRLRFVDSDGGVWRLPNGNPLPELHGLKAWNFDPTNATGSAIMDEGRLYFFKTQFHRSTQPVSITFHVLGAANSPDPSYFGIYDLSGTRLCQTANIASSTTTTGTKTVALVSPPTMVPNYYYIACLFGAGPGQGPTLAITGVPAGIANANLTGANLRFGQGSSTSITSLPSTFTLSTLSATSATLWVGTA